MTGHHHAKQSHGTNPLRIETPTLNQQAAALAQTRANNDPYVQDLAQIEPKFIAELLRRLDTPGADHAVIGAVLLAAGQLAGQVVEMIRPEARQYAAPMITNLFQLAGQQLYMGRLDHATGCPYPLATGKPCNYLGKAETADQLDAVMRGHIAIHHPDHTCPNTEPEPIDG